MKRVYDIVDLLNMAPSEVPRDLKMEVELIDRGISITIRDLHGEIVCFGGLDIPTLISFARHSQLMQKREQQSAE